DWCDIPLELFDCMKLVSLDLSTNNLSGPIPYSISQLELLDNLVLSNNQLIGPIPNEICLGFQKVPLPDYEFVQHYGMLDLSNNNLSGLIPTSIKNCIIMTHLMLSMNKLNGTIPYEIFGLCNLTLLNLSFNLLSGPTLPRFFFKLDLSSNRFVGSLHPFIFSIKSLQYLDVSMNSFSGPLSFGLCSTTSLFSLNAIASNNFLFGSLDASISNLTEISIFDIHNNTINGRVPSLSNLEALTYLDFSRNNFQDA
ncbi:leucine-rich repeat receptor protein kinase MSP1-like protein, partial [Tanacetum coccineum]